MRGLLIKTNGTVTVGDFESLESMQEAVGGYITYVEGNAPDGPMDMVAHDEALMVQDPQENLIAGLLANTRLFGDVIVLGPTDNEGGSYPTSWETELYVRRLASMFALVMNA